MPPTQGKSCSTCSNSVTLGNPQHEPLGLYCSITATYEIAKADSIHRKSKHDGHSCEAYRPLEKDPSQCT